MQRSINLFNKLFGIMEIGNPITVSCKGGKIGYTRDKPQLLIFVSNFAILFWMYITDDV